MSRDEWNGDAARGIASRHDANAETPATCRMRRSGSGGICRGMVFVAADRDYFYDVDRSVTFLAPKKDRPEYAEMTLLYDGTR